MPLYEYECESCAHRFEVIQKFSDPLVDVCPKCGCKVGKLLSSPAIQFKGSGFYINDYARKGTADQAGKSDQGDKTDKTDKADTSGKSSEKSTETSKAGATSDNKSSPSSSTTSSSSGSTDSASASSSSKQS